MPAAPVTKHSIFSENAEGSTQSWVDSLPEELRGSAELRKFKDVNEALKGYTNLCSLAGKKGLRAPDEGAGEEAWNAYYAARRGGVESPQNYSAKYDAEAFLGISQEDFDTISAYMFQNGFSDAEHTKAMTLLAGIREREADLWEQNNLRRMQECERDLRHEWGADYDANISAVRNFMGKFPEVAKTLQTYGLENDVHMCRMLLAVAERTAEASAPKVPTRPEGTYADLQSRLNKLMASEAYQDPKSAGHKMAQEQFFELMKEKARFRAAGMV